MQRPFQPRVPHIHQGPGQPQQAGRLLPGLCLPSLQALGAGATGDGGGCLGAAGRALKVQRQVVVQEEEVVSLEGALQGLTGGPGGRQKAAGGGEAPSPSPWPRG